MKTSIILFLLLATSLASKLHFEIDKWRHHTENDYEVIDIPCGGGSGNYEYEIIDYPPGWYLKDNRIYVPSYKLKDEYYGCRFLIFDIIERKTLKKSLIFRTSSGHFS